MYIPNYFRNKNLPELENFIRQNPFAILINQHDGKPWATHIPVELEKTESGAAIASPQPDWPQLNEVLLSMEHVHEAAMKFVSALDDSVLDEPAYVKASDWNTDKRHVIMHAIRHEGIHVGHLSWLCKLHGIKTL